jgi:hypothetical protein
LLTDYEPKESALPNIVESTAAFEKWAARDVNLIRSDVGRKHQLMAAAPFAFFRATFYRWAQWWPIVCPELAGAPQLLAIGDLHVLASDVRAIPSGQRHDTRNCHQNPVTGGSSQFMEIRAGHLDANGNFVAATVPINDGANTIALRSIINDRALNPQAQEHVPDAENIRALRAALNTLGDGFVEAIAASHRRQPTTGQRRQNSRRSHRSPSAGGAWADARRAFWLEGPAQ